MPLLPPPSETGIYVQPMDGSPALPRARAARGLLTPEEIQEAQQLGILPAPAPATRPLTFDPMRGGLQMPGPSFPGFNQTPTAPAPAPVPAPQAAPTQLAPAPQAVPTPAPAPQAAPAIPPAITGGPGLAPQAPNPGPTTPAPVSAARSQRRLAAPPVAAPAEPAPDARTVLTQSIAARRAQYNKELDAASQTPDYTLLSQAMRARAREGDDNMYASALAGLGPSAVQGFQPALLKQALASQDPMRIEGGQIDASGRVMLDPGYQANKKIEALRNKLLQLDQLEARMVSEDQKAELARERNQTMLAIRAMTAMAAGNQNKASTWGFAPDGRRIVETQDGTQYAINPDGSRTLYTGAAIAKAPFSKDVTQATDLQGSLARIDQYIGLAKKFPGAFNWKATGASMLPEAGQSRVMPRVLTPEQLYVRNLISKDAAIELHKIYGAALTMGESARAAQWAPGPSDSPETTISKLKAAKGWYEMMSQSQPQAVRDVAQSRMTPGPQPIPGPGRSPQAAPDLAAAAAAELQRRAAAARTAGGR